ncbi:MAG TPA: AraC family transcriptional regulator [Myxococcaceae bacterium]|nr:AraC family transcriptional regulator [Myxococcaceae bacterium]
MVLTRDVLARLCRARDLLCEEHAPSVREVARHVEISLFHFIRQFEAAFGVTPRQFRIGSRIQWAKRLLAVGRLSVTDVCMEVGFSSLGSFSDTFARRVGTRPSEYRRRARAMIHDSGMVPHPLEPGCLSLMALLPESGDAISEKRE